MNIDWKEIKEKYPLAHDKAHKDLDLWSMDICYCDLEKFFDENGIIIDITYIEDLKILNKILQSFCWSITDIKKDEYIWSENWNDYLSRTEAKEAAIYKAFEILNNQLKDK